MWTVPEQQLCIYLICSSLDGGFSGSPMVGSTSGMLAAAAGSGCHYLSLGDQCASVPLLRWWCHASAPLTAADNTTVPDDGESSWQGEDSNQRSLGPMQCTMFWRRILMTKKQSMGSWLMGIILFYIFVYFIIDSGRRLLKISKHICIDT